ncbi:hypothetical protein J7J08_07645 [Stenotrophomonas sp. ISL-67]|uniref:hypothetical protein n=1 Tax=Stenotrophomonas sp. ISL-67 TaxID=2819171 RepID=UPI001BE6E93D|nr:hypothetical protein [Stenotrophomonas sp. ISL-67]MBT2767510.1 hypothetical protein [Stenotrophomonas sp. ISL-67]
MSRIATFTIIGLLLAAPMLSAQAQTKRSSAAAKPKKLFCWNEGKERICSDALPQDAVNNAREEFSVTSGLRKGGVERTLTEEERADAAVAAAQRQLDDAAEQTRKRTEQAMLSTYQDEADLRRVFVERTGILDNNVQTANYNVASLRGALVTLLGSAGDRELAGQPVVAKQAEAIRLRHAELVAQKRMQASYVEQRKALDVEIEETLQRYRLLKGVSTDPRG